MATRLPASQRTRDRITRDALEFRVGQQEEPPPEDEGGPAVVL
jgi:hypothetical protein